MHHQKFAFILLALLVLAAGCGQLSSPQPSLPEDEEGVPSACLETEESIPEMAPVEEQPQQDKSSQNVCTPVPPSGPETRASCYKLQPGAVRAKDTKSASRQPRNVGRCQPQSLIYARCRSGLQTCRLGDTSPVQWFACARKNGNISQMPQEGSIMVLDANERRKMPTGHPVYVETVSENGNGTWQLRISHTNYDRQCHLDLDSVVLYDPARLTASFQSGPWGSWARDLRVLGFIVR